MPKAIPAQVHECKKCGFRYPTPLKQRVWCPNRHLGAKKNLLPAPEMTVIWSRTDGGEPPAINPTKDES